jgi:hypothetical protein
MFKRSLTVSLLVLSLSLSQVMGAEEAKEKGEEKDAPKATSTETVGRTANNAISVELLGAGILYSLGYTRLFMDHIAVNLGLSYLSLSVNEATTGASGSATLIQVPVSASYLFFGNYGHFLELGAGLNVMAASASVSVPGAPAQSGSATALMPQFALAYRRFPLGGGFHLRTAFYAMALDGKFFPYTGFSFGFAF